jgi:hypothetical protein
MPETTYEDPQSFPVDTKLGPMTITVHSNSCVEVKVARETPIKVNRVPYQGRVYVYLHETAPGAREWIPHEKFNAAAGRGEWPESVYMYRADGRRVGEQPNYKAIATIAATAVEVARQFAGDFPQFLAEGQRRELGRDLVRLTNEEREMAVALERLRVTIAAKEAAREILAADVLRSTLEYDAAKRASRAVDGPASE